MVVPPPDPDHCPVMADDLDLEVRIREELVEFRLEGRDYKGTPRFEDATLADLDELRREGDALQYGQTLFEATFGDPQLRTGLGVLRSWLGRNRDHNCGLRLAVDLDCARLHTLWWESLNDPERGEFNRNPLATHARTPVSRYIAGTGGDALPIGKLRLLVAVSSPKDLESDTWPDHDPIPAEREFDAIHAALEDLADRVEIVDLDGPVTPRRLAGQLREVHAVHLVAHGGFDGDRAVILLEHDDGEIWPVSEDEFMSVLGYSDNLRLVVLAACDSATRSRTDPLVGLAPKLLGPGGVPAVVAMQDQVDMDLARKFASEFYEALAQVTAHEFGRVDTAVNRARAMLRFERLNDQGAWDWAKPVLFLHGNGRLFERHVVDETAPQLGAGQRPDSRARAGGGGTPGFSAGDVAETMRIANRLVQQHKLTDGEVDDVCAALGLDPAEFQQQRTQARVIALVRRCKEQDELVALFTAVGERIRQRADVVVEEMLELLDKNDELREAM